MSRIQNAFFAGALSVGLTACGSPSSPASPTASAGTVGELRPGTRTIVEIVVADDGEFDVLQAAVIRAGLADALSGGSQLTVFAPTDAAFVAALAVADEAAAVAAIGALPVETLRNILLYHVTHGRRTSASVVAAPRYQMLNGETLTRDRLTAAGLATTDISASNGIVHAINAILMP